MGDSEQHTRGSAHAAISNSIVKLIGEYTGRGPTQARTVINGDLVVVLLRDTLTKGERSLVASDRSEVVLATRRSYQQAMRDDATDAIQEILGRRVIGFMSGNHIDPDLAIEAFVLDEPVTNHHERQGNGTIPKARADWQPAE